MCILCMYVWPWKPKVRAADEDQRGLLWVLDEEMVTSGSSENRALERVCQYYSNTGKHTHTQSSEYHVCELFKMLTLYQLCMYRILYVYPYSASVWAATPVWGEPPDGLWPGPLWPDWMVWSDSEQPIISQCNLSATELHCVSVFREPES